MTKKDITGPHDRYKQQRWRALARGVAWELTFDQWMSIWDASGHFHERGKKAGQYVMARNGDVGPYSVSNVRICLFTENIAEARSLQPERFQIIQLGSGRGWTKRKSGKRPYQVVVADKYVGVFATQAEAEAAYALEVARVSHAANCFAPH
jgi:hypothetical protein